MNKLIKFILILLISINITGCGVFHKVFKKSSKTKEDIYIKVSEIDSSVIKDKSITTIKEKIDTAVTIKGNKEVSKIDIKDLTDIKNLIIFSNDLYDVNQNYDTLTKSLNTVINLKDRKVGVKLDKETVVSNDIVINKNIKKDSSFNSSTKTKLDVKQKEPKNTFWFIILT